MSATKRSGKPFSELIDDVRSAATDRPVQIDAEARVWPQPIRERHWVDADGSAWHMRGNTLSAAKARKLARRDEERVLHAYGVDPHIVDGHERESLLARLDAYFAGDAPAHSEFQVADFRDAERRVLLVVQESC